MAGVLVAVVEGLRGFPEAITAVFADTQVQTCIVHLIRHSMSRLRSIIKQRRSRRAPRR